MEGKKHLADIVRMLVAWERSLEEEQRARNAKTVLVPYSSTHKSLPADHGSEFGSLPTDSAEEPKYCCPENEGGLCANLLIH